MMPEIPIEDAIELLKSEGYEIFTTFLLPDTINEIRNHPIYVPEEFTLEELYTRLLAFQYGIEEDTLLSIAYPFARIGKTEIEKSKLKRDGNHGYSQKEWEDFMYYACGLPLVVEEGDSFRILIDPNNLFFPFGFIPSLSIKCQWSEEYKECYYETPYGYYLGERTKNIYSLNEFTGELTLIEDITHRCITMGGEWSDKYNRCIYPTPEQIRRLFQIVGIPIEKIRLSPRGDGMFIYSEYFAGEEVNSYKYEQVTEKDGEKVYERTKRRKTLHRMFIFFGDPLEDIRETLIMNIVEAYRRMGKEVSPMEVERIVRLLI